MTKRSRNENRNRQNSERELTSQFRAIRIRAVAETLEHYGNRNNAMCRPKHSAPHTRNKTRSE